MEQIISINDLKKMLMTNRIILIDIREHYLFERGTIPGSINIPHRILKEMPEKYLLTGERYYIFCDEGIMSLKLANYLNQLGYHVISIEGGYAAFEKS